MLEIIDDICKDFYQQRTQDLFLINLDQSMLIICEVNVERNISDPILSNKYKNSGFLHAVAQAIAQLNLYNTLYTPHPGIPSSL